MFKIRNNSNMTVWLNPALIESIRSTDPVLRHSGTYSILRTASGQEIECMSEPEHVIQAMEQYKLARE